MGKERKSDKWLEAEGLILISGWARDGLSDKQIAQNMGIAYSTFRVWRDKYPAIADALKNSKELADRVVENALYKKAIGYNAIVVKAIKIKDPYFDECGRRIDREKIVKVEETIHVPGDTGAQVFWLKNRKPDKWRDKPESVTTEAYEDDGLLAALDAKIDDSDDDSWMLEEGENNETC